MQTVVRVLRASITRSRLVAFRCRPLRRCKTAGTGMVKTEEMRLLQEELRTALVETLTRRLDYGIAAYHARQT